MADAAGTSSYTILNSDVGAILRVEEISAWACPTPAAGAGPPPKCPISVALQKAATLKLPATMSEPLRRCASWSSVASSDKR